MSFKELKKGYIDAIQAGSFQHEMRTEIRKKNLVYAGVVTADEFVEMLKGCRGNQYQRDVHHADSSKRVDIFTPKYCGESWYIKMYHDDAGGGDIIVAIVISVHQQAHATVREQD